MKTIELFDGMAPLAERYDGYVVDLWGVLHDGVTAFPHALDCLARLRALGKGIVVLSNAPRRSSEVAGRMSELGIPAALYDFVLSSGEIAWHCLRDRPDDWYRKLGNRCFHLGPERDHGMRDGLPLDFVDEPAAAEFILNTGAHSALDTAETYARELETGIALGLPMVCANPDLEVIRGGRREICAGALAKRYQELGGEVRYHGKPHAGTYDDCFAALGNPERSRVAAIGDSLRTDIAGATAAGFDGIFIVGGIYAEGLGVVEGEMPPVERLAELYASEGQWPVAAMPLFRWQPRIG
jgi:HAD superfamily hydrolase (TIGR01459 family)